MTDSNDQTDKTIRVGARKPLSLQRTVESGHVRQNFSHGRSKSVVVEKKKTRRLGPGSEGAEVAPAAAPIETPLRQLKLHRRHRAGGTRNEPTARTNSFQRGARRARTCACRRAGRGAGPRRCRDGALRARRHEPQTRSEDAKPQHVEPAVASATAAAAAAPAAAPAPAARDSAPRESRERRDAGPGAPRRRTSALPKSPGASRRQYLHAARGRPSARDRIPGASPPRCGSGRRNNHREADPADTAGRRAPTAGRR